MCHGLFYGNLCEYIVFFKVHFDGNFNGMYYKAMIGVGGGGGAATL